MARSDKRTFQFIVAGENHRVTLFCDEQGYRLQLADRRIELKAQAISDNALLLDRNERSIVVYLARSGDQRFLCVGGRQYAVDEVGESSERVLAHRPQALGVENALVSPMPGQVVKILVAEGDVVEARQTVAIVEAMKMENELKASARAKVNKIYALAGDLVDAGQVIVELEPE
jgi:propionyl-CoA carboxylase alpha chain